MCCMLHAVQAHAEVGVVGYDSWGTYVSGFWGNLSKLTAYFDGIAQKNRPPAAGGGSVIPYTYQVPSTKDCDLCCCGVYAQYSVYIYQYRTRTVPRHRPQFFSLCCTAHLSLSPLILILLFLYYNKSTEYWVLHDAGCVLMCTECGQIDVATI